MAQPKTERFTAQQVADALTATHGATEHNGRR